MVWKVYFVSMCVIVSNFRNFHHVTLEAFDVYLHAWLYVYNMERRGVRFDHIFDEIDRCLVWFRFLGTRLIFSESFNVQRRDTMFPKQCVYRPKTWLGTNTVSPKPCLYRVQYFMENSVFAYYIHTLRVGTDPVFSKIQRVGIFEKNRVWQGLYILCTTL